MLIEIEKESVEPELTRKTVVAEEVIALFNAKVAAMKRECANDLAQTMRLLNSALTVLDTLKKSNMDLVKSEKIFKWRNTGNGSGMYYEGH